MASYGADASTHAPAEGKKNSTESISSKRNSTKNITKTFYYVNKVKHDTNEVEISPSSLENSIEEVQTREKTKPKQRQRWTKEMNSDLIRCYFEAVYYNTNSYRKEMHALWNKRYPNFFFSEQRLCDQKRAIMARLQTSIKIRGNWLTQIEIDTIRREVITKNEQTTSCNNKEKEKNDLFVEEAEFEGKENNPIEHQNATQNQQNATQNQQNVKKRETIEKVNSNNDELNRITGRLIELYENANLTSLENRVQFRKPNKKNPK